MNLLKTTLYSLFLCSLSSLAAFPQCPPPSSQQNEPAPCPQFQGRNSHFPIGGDVALALDYFRSLPDGSWAGNFGAYSSLNLATALSPEKYGFGAQAGGSYGLYDWDGRGSNTPGNTKALQQQGFLTLGLFRRTAECSGFNAGLVYDFMFNKQFGVFALDPYLTQLRGQFAYLFRGGNELGVWATVNTNVSHREFSETPVKFRAISQVNLFWGHHFKNKAETLFWAGTPYRRGLMYSSSRAGRYLIGASFRAPLTKALSLIGHGVYMASTSGPATQESRNYAANICFGVNYSFGGSKVGQRPYLSLADNSNFLVDTNQNF